MFDYRSVDDEQLRVALDACAPDLPARTCNYQLAVFILAPDAHQALETATIADWSKGMVVPYVEAGYPTAIQVTAVEELLIVHVDHVPSQFELAHMARSAKDAGQG